MKDRVVLVLWGEDVDCRACALRDAGWFVEVENEDGGRAFRIIRNELPDAIVIDLSRRAAHGRELARALRETAATRRLPLIFVGGSTEAAEKALAAAPEAQWVPWEELLTVLAALEKGE